MRKTKFIITLLMAVLMTFSSAFCISVSAASSPDEAVISGNYDGIEPIPTEKPEDKPVKHGKGFSSGDYALFYTQTTFLALLAGYLIIFKVKGTKTKEKMHRSFYFFGTFVFTDPNTCYKKFDCIFYSLVSTAFVCIYISSQHKENENIRYCYYCACCIQPYQRYYRMVLGVSIN